MDSYTESEVDFLLSLARRTLETITRANGGVGYNFDHAMFSLAGDLEALPPALQAKRAAFVTLEVRATGELRGCTGTLEARLPLAYEVIYSTHHTAFYDPRFEPVQAAEVGRLRIEISILTPSQPLVYTDDRDLLSKLRPGVDGVTLSYAGRRATFLPQVWERLTDPDAFLNALCHKMGLPANTWRKAHLNVETYTAVKLVEP